MKGILYAVGVGPGDPELLTIKAERIIREADVIACPSKDNEPGIAFGIACQACPKILEKEKLCLDFPMKEGDRSKAHLEAAKSIIAVLQTGKSVAFLTLGDPGMYSTFSYISEMIQKEGYDINVVSGVPSFCSASAVLKLPLAVGNEEVLITSGEFKDFDGTLIIMKAGKKLSEIKKAIIKTGRRATLVENCGMINEKVYPDISSFPDEAGYFSLLIVKR